MRTPSRSTAPASNSAARRWAIGALAVAAIALPAAVGAPAGAQEPVETTSFTFTGSPQAWTVPDGVQCVAIAASGGSGGSGGTFDGKASGWGREPGGRRRGAHPGRSGGHLPGCGRRGRRGRHRWRGRDRRRRRREHRGRRRERGTRRGRRRGRRTRPFWPSTAPHWWSRRAAVVAAQVGPAGRERPAAPPEPPAATALRTLQAISTAAAAAPGRERRPAQRARPWVATLACSTRHRPRARVAPAAPAVPPAMVAVAVAVALPAAAAATRASRPRVPGAAAAPVWLPRAPRRGSEPGARRRFAGGLAWQVGDTSCLPVTPTTTTTTTTTTTVPSTTPPSPASTPGSVTAPAAASRGAAPISFVG